LSPWLVFLISAAIVVVVADRLAKYGDVIAVRTNLGGLLMGTIFMAAATSLPEFMTAISAFRAGAPDLAAGNFYGSNMVNILLLALVDLVNYRVPLLSRMAITHTITAVLGMMLMVLSVIFIMADIETTIGWVGVDSLVLIALYFGGVWLIQQANSRVSGARPKNVVVSDDFPSLTKGLIGFLIAAAILVLVVPQLVQASAEIAIITGLGDSFVGVFLLSVVTSLPELLAALAAVRMGAFDLAVGNIFGSIVFNMLGLGVADFFYTEGRLLGAIDPGFVLVGLLGLFLTTMALMANLARIERKVLFIELDAIAIIIAYLAGIYMLFVRRGGA
jgi:cation:H+ antiporter